MQKTELSLVKSDLVNLCSTLYALAQKHVSTTSVADVNELVQIGKILHANDIPLKLSPKIKAHATDYSSNVVRQAPEYRLIRARFAAALGTIADMGSKRVRKNKSEFHAGINEGLRRAAKVAIMFLEDLDANMFSLHTYDEANDPEKVTEFKPRGRFVR